jgi:hypothetical protein
MAPVTRLPPVTALTAAPPAAPSPAPLSARSVVELPQAATVAKIKPATAKFAVVLMNKTSFWSDLRTAFAGAPIFWRPVHASKTYLGLESSGLS